MRTSLLAALVVLAAVVAGCDSGSAASAPPDPAVPDLSAPAGDMPAVPVDQALSAASAYFAAFNGGDVDAVVSLLPTHATFSDSITGDSSREAWERRLVWNVAQGTRLAPWDCTVPPDGLVAGSTVVRCESATLNAQIQAVGSRPVPTVVVFTVTPNGIQSVREEYGRPDFLLATRPFMEWMGREHPVDAGRIGFAVWDTEAEARANGELTAHYARRWAAYLEANCVRIPDLISPDRDSYLDDC